MSMVPFVFRDWWDDFDRDRPARLLDQHFGMGLRRDDLFKNLCAISPSSAAALRPGRYFRPWNEFVALENRGASNVKIDENQYQVSLDVQQFSPNEITVKVTDGTIVVEGKHEEKPDEHGFISRQFTRKYVLPKELDVDNIVSSLSSDGVLTVSVPKKKVLAPGERVVPITQTGAPAIKPTPAAPASQETNIKIQQT